MKRMVSKLVPIVAGVALGLAVLAPMTSAVGLSDSATRCGGVGNAVAGEMDVAAASDFWKAFPAAGMAPELEQDSAPAHLVVFQGKFDAANLALVGVPGADQPAVANVVCVLHQNGTIDVYANVPFAGSAFAP